MSKTNDLTSGNVSSKLLKFFFPILLTNCLQQVYSIADTAIVGKGIGDNALGAVGNLASLFFFIIGFSTGITNGFAVIIGQFFGSDDREELKRSVALSAELSFVIALFLTIIGLLILKPILMLIQTDELIMNDSLAYGYIIFGGLSITIAYNLCSGILRSLGDSKTPFVAIMVSSIINILMDSILIFIFHTGVTGAAAATIFSQAVSTLICYLKIRRIPEIRTAITDFIPDIKMFGLLLKNGSAMAFMNSITAIGTIVVQRYVNSCGVSFTSAYSVCVRYLNLFMLPSMTAGMHASAFVSQNFGARKPDRIRQGVHVCIAIAFSSYILLGLLAILLPRQLAAFMLNGDDTITLASSFLRTSGIFIIILNLLFVFRSAVQGMGYPFIPMLSGFAEMILRIPVIIMLLPGLELRAAAFADAFAWAGALILNFIAYLYYYSNLEKNQL